MLVVSSLGIMQNFLIAYVSIELILYYSTLSNKNIVIHCKILI